MMMKVIVELVEDYFSAASVIDISNHCRQAGLALETAWSTQRWDHRVISTILRIIETDRYHMWHNFHPHSKEYAHAQFIEEVAYNYLISEEASESYQRESMALTGTSEEEAGTCNSLQQAWYQATGITRCIQQEWEKGAQTLP